MSSIEIFLGGEPLGAAIESLSFERTERADEEVRPVGLGHAEWSIELRVGAVDLGPFVEAGRSVEVEMIRAPLDRSIERLIGTRRYPEGARIDLAAASARVRAMSRQLLGRAYRGERQRRRAMRRLLRALRAA